MKAFLVTLILILTATSYTNAQIQIKKKAEKKANQAIDDFLFGKKKKKKDASTSDDSSGTNSSGNETGGADDYTPEEVDFGSLDLSQSIDFRTLINMLPERTQGFVREGKPQGARYNTQGVAYSFASKNYLSGDREMTISLNDYLGAEFIATAQSAQQFEYESTEGYAKSIEVDGIPGWISIDYSDQSGTLFLYFRERFYATVQAENTNEAELKSAASDIQLSRLKSEISE